MGFFYCLFSAAVLIDGDELQYDTIAKNLAKNNVFSREHTPPFHPTINREPLYPLFLASIYKVFNDSLLAARIAQSLVFSLTIIVFYSITLKLTDDRIAFCSSIVSILCPPLANYTSYILSETLFIFLLVVFVYVSTMMKSRQTNKNFVASGIILGLLTLFKAQMLYFLPFLILCIIVLKFEKGVFLPILLVVISFFITLLPWLYRNYYLFDTWKITGQRAGMVLNARAMKISYNLIDYKNTAVYYFSEELGRIVYPDAVIKSKAYMDQFNPVVEGRDNEQFLRDLLHKKSYDLKEGTIIDLKIQDLKRDGFSEMEIDSILTNEALQKIKARPFKYLLQTPFELIKMTAFTYLPLLNDERITSRISVVHKRLVFLIKGLIRLIAYPILGLAVYGIYQYRSRWKEFLPVLMIVVFFNLFYGLTFGYARYAAPLIPFYIMFATMGWFKLKERKNVAMLQQSMCIL